VRYQTNQEQNDKDEKENSGDLSRSKSYDSKTKDTGCNAITKKTKPENGSAFNFFAA